MLPRLPVVLMFAALGLAACAGSPAVELQVQIKLNHASTDGTQVARHASAVAGVPVRYVSSTNEQWHAIALQCNDASQCDRAVQRLRADTSTYLGVDVDARRRVHSP